MATYEADVWLGSSSGRQKIRVNSNTLNGAKEQLVNLYHLDDPINDIRNLREVRSSNSNSTSSDSGAWVGLIGIFGLGWLFMTFTPWVLMLFGGMSACWFTQKITGLNLEDYEDEHIRALLIITLTLVAGGYGFVKGNEIKQEFEAEQNAAKVVYVKSA